MSWIGLAGWILAGFGAATAVWLWMTSRHRAVRLAQSCHELRGPLGAIRLGIDLGLRQGRLGPDRMRALDLQLERAAAALADLSGTASDERPEAVCLADLADDVAAALAPLASQLHVAVSVTAIPRVSLAAPRARLAQAVTNLVANAIEHGGGRVTVSGRVGEGVARLEILDDGLGLPRPLPELLRRNQRRGWLGPRIPGRPVRPRGHGLCVAAEVAALQGGRLLSAPSERGARLVLELPLGQQPLERGSTTIPAPR